MAPGVLGTATIYCDGRLQGTTGEKRGLLSPRWQDKMLKIINKGKFAGQERRKGKVEVARRRGSFAH